MARGGYIGHGVRIGYATSSPQTWNELEQVDDTNTPGVESDKIEVTVHGLPGRRKAFIAGEQTVDDVRIMLLRDAYTASSPNQNALQQYNESSESLYWRIEIPTTPDASDDMYEAFEFTARVGTFRINPPRADKVMLEITLVHDGQYYAYFGTPGPSEF